MVANQRKLRGLQSLWLPYPLSVAEFLLAVSVGCFQFNPAFSFLFHIYAILFFISNSIRGHKISTQAQSPEKHRVNYHSLHASRPQEQVKSGCKKTQRNQGYASHDYGYDGKRCTYEPGRINPGNSAKNKCGSSLFQVANLKLSRNGIR